MSSRPRLTVAVAILGGMLAVLLLGVGASSASQVKSGKVYASLTKTSFTAAKAGSVKLVCKFSPASKRWNYVLSRKSGSKWTKVRGLNRRGSFKGTRKTTVKKLFGSKPVKVGSYRVKVSADSNSVTRSFKVVKKASSSGGSGGGGTVSGGTVPKPNAGRWQSTELGNPHSVAGATVSSVSFNVALNQATVSGFAFVFDYSGVAIGCSGEDVHAAAANPSPVSGGQFSVPSETPWNSTSSQALGSGTFHGTFDSATSAHGTASFSYSTLCTPSSFGTTGTFSWTATWRSAS